MNTELERAAFDAWFTKTKAYISDPKDIFAQIVRDTAWEAWQAGRAALQSQDREDVERLEWLVENMGRVDIDEGHRGWFVLERDTTNYLVEDCKTFREAIDHARRAEGDGE